MVYFVSISDFDEEKAAEIRRNSDALNDALNSQSRYAEEQRLIKHQQWLKEREQAKLDAEAANEARINEIHEIVENAISQAIAPLNAEIKGLKLTISKLSKQSNE